MFIRNLQSYFSAFVLIACSLAAFAQSPADADPAQQELDQGVASYKAQRYEDAVEHFRQAVSLAPQSIKAHLFLASAYSQMYIPGAQTAENLKCADNAVAEYRVVLEHDPKNVSAIKGIAFLSMNMKRWDDALNYYQRATEVDPEDPEAFYSVGVIEWTIAYKYRMDLRKKSRLGWDAQAYNRSICPEIRAHNWNGVQHGMEMFDKAMKLRPDYDDAMAYQNLMYRERADMQCGDKASHDADLKVADEWVDKVMTTKKAKVEAEEERRNSIQ